MKTLIIADLHRILFATTFESDPDNWDLRVMLAKALLRHHRLWSKDNDQIKDAQYWQHGIEAEDHFFDTICPGITPSVTEFEYICENYFDFEMYEKVQAVGSIEKVAEDLFSALGQCLRPEPQYGVTMLISSPDKAA